MPISSHKSSRTIPSQKSLSALHPKGISPRLPREGERAAQQALIDPKEREVGSAGNRVFFRIVRANVSAAIEFNRKRRNLVLIGYAEIEMGLKRVSAGGALIEPVDVDDVCDPDLSINVCMVFIGGTYDLLVDTLLA